MSSLAPIAISTYSRLNHLQKTVEALKRNPLSGQSELYIFSDAPKVGDENIVRLVRSYIHTIDGFKKVTVFERKENSRVNNNRGGIKHLLDIYGKLIFLEEDIVTAPGFLTFMNDGLKFFKNDQRIMSITGYSPPINASNYCDDDFFILPRFNAWGFGIWKDRYEKISYISKEEFKEFLWNKRTVLEFMNGGEDMIKLLHLDVYGKIDALDVKAMFSQFKSNQFTVYPRKSIVRNVGHDGSGLHCGVTDKFDVNLWEESNFNFNNDIALNWNIIKANKKFRSLGINGKIIKLTIILGIYYTLKQVKDKIYTKWNF